MIQDYKDFLKTHNLSVTPARVAVLKALETYPHSDAEKIYKAVRENIDSTSKQAIYNNLHTLVEYGLVREIKPKGQPSLYETRVGDNHHHIVCRNCAAVMDTDCFDAAPCLTPKDSHGFIVDEAEVIFWGTCPACQTTHNQKGEKHG